MRCYYVLLGSAALRCVALRAVRCVPCVACHAQSLCCIVMNWCYFVMHVYVNTI